MNKSTISLTSILFMSVAGCSTIQSALNCPDDPFDPSASGACRLTYSGKQQRTVIDRESGKGTDLKTRGDVIASETRASETELTKLEKEASSLRAQLKKQETKTRAAEKRLNLARKSGELTENKLDALELQLVSIKEKIKEAESTRGSSSGDVKVLKRLKKELDAELDALLDEL